MNSPYRVIKVLNNNVAIVTSNDQELILIGKGIGFGRKERDIITSSNIEKFYVLSDEAQQSQYKQLIESLDEGFVELTNELIQYSEKALNTTFNEHIHIALTDHLAFAIKRLKQGMDIRNPFIEETKVMYPKEFLVAKEVVLRLNSRLNIKLPDGEVGFVALHIHSAMTNSTLSQLNKYSQLINRLINIIEAELEVRVEYESINYLRLVQHLRNAIVRVDQGEKVDHQEKLAEVLKSEYPICYNLAWKLIKVMQNTLQKPVSDAEAVYLSLHLQRLSPK